MEVFGFFVQHLIIWHDPLVLDLPTLYHIVLGFIPTSSYNFIDKLP